MLVVSISIPKMLRWRKDPHIFPEEAVCQVSHMSLSLSPCLLYTRFNSQNLYPIWLYNHQDNGILLGYRIGAESIQVHLPHNGKFWCGS